jgi:hypothetical protein
MATKAKSKKPTPRKPKTTPHRVVDARDFLDHVELDAVVAYEERARRRQEQPAPEEPETQSAMGFQDQDERRFEYRFRTQFEDKHGLYVADFAARYVSKEPLDVPREAVLEFAERVAFMAVYPYHRASIQASAARLGNPAPVLGLVRQGDLKFGSELEAEELSNLFSLKDDEDKV